jgi:hypothetical protein
VDTEVDRVGVDIEAADMDIEVGPGPVVDLT